MCVCIYVTMWGLKTGLMSSASKPEQIDRNKVLPDSKWSVWPHIKSDLDITRVNKQALMDILSMP